MQTIPLPLPREGARVVAEQRQELGEAGRQEQDLAPRRVGLVSLARRWKKDSAVSCVPAALQPEEGPRLSRSVDGRLPRREGLDGAAPAVAAARAVVRALDPVRFEAHTRSVPDGSPENVSGLRCGS